ncbi:hypothetical protein QR680_009668 [Steinernema hermaphroditum]|uniref:Protein SET n=1 Tax=Steinernema hermaphroditum TaxID=289476 RepID=A0AA39M9B3_9BILA|nr:hypothetical protein QR680_009668 [Steinernema hermaphroditum]
MSEEPASKRGKFEEDAAAGSSVLNAEMSKKYEAALKEIDTVQAEIDTLNEKASEEILAVERKYNIQRKPHYEKRNEVIEKIPNFWVASFVNHPTLSTIITEDDEDCLHYMTKLEIEEYDDTKSGYKLTFHFAENPYIENEVISKEFFIGVQEPVSNTTDIKWKSGKNLAQRRSGAKNDGISRSFFEWLVDNEDPTSDDIAEIIKDDVWPNPLQYFLTPGSEAGDFGEDDDDDGAESDGADAGDDEHPDDEAAEGEQVDEEEE